MSKRVGDLNEGPSKKQKTELDHLWGDDFKDEDLDDCFQLASQIYEREVVCTQRNVSIVPSYTAFKQKSKNVFTSTQSNPELNTSLTNPSTSTNNLRTTTNGCDRNNINSSHASTNNGFKRTFCFENNKVSDLQTKLQRVQEQYFAKEGEVSILRTQLKDIRFQNDREHVKKEKEWTEKYASINKNFNAVKSELEFKNLEIANLKQQVAEKIKVVNRDSQLLLTQSIVFKQPKNLDRCTQVLNQSLNVTNSSRNVKQSLAYEDFIICNSIEKTYPLHCIDSTFFNPPSEEKYTSDIQNISIHGNSILFSQETDRLQPQLTQFRLPNDRELNIDYIHSDMLYLMKCTSEELEMSESYSYINKIVCTSEQLCDNLYKVLLKMENDFVDDSSGRIDISQIKKNFNTKYCSKSLFSPDECTNSEMGIGARQSIVCIAHTLHYSNYLRQYLLENKQLIFKGDEDYLTYLPIAKLKVQTDYVNSYHYLNIIQSIVNISGKLKISQSISGFLSAVCVLLDKIYSSNVVAQELYVLVTKLTREIVFVCPNVQVLYYLSDFFKNAALQDVFVKDLCTMSCKGSLQLDQKEKSVYCKEDVCMLLIFCILVEYSLCDGKCYKMLSLYAVVISFIKACFKEKPKWGHYHENKHCDCLNKIIILGINILYQVVEDHKKVLFMVEDLRRNNDYWDLLSSYGMFLQNGIELLQIFKYKVYDVMVNYIATYSQYKVIIKSLLSLKGELNLKETHIGRLQDLIDTEDTSAIITDETSISLWN